MQLQRKVSSERAAYRTRNAVAYFVAAKSLLRDQNCATAPIPREDANMERSAHKPKEVNNKDPRGNVVAFILHRTLRRDSRLLNPFCFHVANYCQFAQSLIAFDFR